ncbi:3,4-dihydroxy-2-butanone-4-phosphate synthase [Staphylococcus epidermidis]|jgi:3,4-dihydroxy 2-butanone 4-phosphate synthase/GTP cyclohydrolase II|uniref:Riboflavin biosynthesis protein RibBA n=2 Tax=Staphylococcus epidermidis TaxID=1282 RepID=RIBBA_STAES|nr:MULTISPECIES: 3,4-dihydroxy-2-butanone-4-phosphate synthase [Staphylococcus]Q8CNU2.1 RecName: Full=Riboflavin biosynthesis protein RibBA; Includes: RecName: Full=3,4-dihydroxy-2-butanone 4-phosphate synthase; Short=DHBP synthase; Includes: RecName: Full=GTP cyclohydrolase-2; AltName: Full=GTP cyclohydrolase II [Staphylococcus epidermidis ATCC 12228]AAO05038.1 riboflavin biosynthesis protein [Staphylococcus epidermidis ATCC 12228]AIR81678.1 GTP cyclohydrolase II [Staphylococcus epidermidis]AJ
MQFDTIELAIEALRNGESIIVVDDEDRENEGDLVAVTEWMDDNTINFMAKEGRGLICAPIDKSIAERLKLQSMEQNNTDIYGTHFTVSIDHYKTTTGISAHERTQTARALIDENTNPEDFHRPGHLFPLIAKENGVLTRNGHTEAAVDLARLTGAQPAGVICEIMNDDGTMAKGEDLQSFKERHHLKMITIKSLVAFRKAVELNVNLKAKVKMPTDFGHFDMYGFTTDYSDEEIVAIVKGDLKSNPNVRMHSACLTGDIFHSQRCDCGAQLEASMKYIDEHGGMIIYLPQEGRGIGLINKLRAYELIEKGYDTVTANLALGFDEDLRDYHVAAEILKYFDISEINLLSNNPKKFEGLEDYGIEIVDRIELIVPETQYNHSYMETKKNKMGHLI